MNEALRYAIDHLGSSDAIDPHHEPAANRRYWEIYEGLTSLGADGSVRPALAERWERLAPETVRFWLRPGARFEDGGPCRSSDVVASLQRARKPSKSFTVASRLSSVAEIAAVDDQTVDVITRAPDPLLLHRLADLMIVADVKQGSRPLGTGPYRLVVHDTKRLARLERKDEHDSRHPTAKSVEVWFLPAQDRAAALRAGDVDLIGATPSDRSGLVVSGFRTVVGPVTAAAGYFLDNVNPDWPTKDKRVRQAINLAVDKNRILEDIYGGVGEITPGQFAHQNANGHHPGLRPFPYDPERARALLVAAGLDDGFDLTIDTVGYNPKDELCARLVADDLARIGIRSSFAAIPDLETALQRWFGRLPRGHLSPTTLSVAPAMDVEYAFLWFDSNHLTHHYSNPAFDSVFRASQTELVDAVRLRHLRRAAQVLNEDPPFLWLAGTATLYAYGSAIPGFTPRADGAIVPDDLA